MTDSLTNHPSSRTVAGQLVRRDDPTVEIVATLETIPAHAALAGATLTDGHLDLDYAGGSEVFWDDQEVVRTHPGGRSFLDAAGHVVAEVDVALRLADGRLVTPSLPVVSPSVG